jgi:hypothetical protein
MEIHEIWRGDREFESFGREKSAELLLTDIHTELLGFLEKEMTGGFGHFGEKFNLKRVRREPVLKNSKKN